MERGTEPDGDRGVAVPAQLDNRRVVGQQLQRLLQTCGTATRVHHQVAVTGHVARASNPTPSAAATSARPASMSTSVTCTPGTAASRRATQQPTMPAPTTAIRSPMSGAASHNAFTAVSTVPASTRGPGGRIRGRARLRAPERHTPSDAGIGRTPCGRAVLGTVLHDPDAEIAVLHRPREVALLEGCRIASYSLGGTPPRNTSVSVPRLTPDCSVRISTSPRAGSGTGTGLISPSPGSHSQNASASFLIARLDGYLCADRAPTDPTVDPVERGWACTTANSSTLVAVVSAPTRRRNHRLRDREASDLRFERRQVWLIVAVGRDRTGRGRAEGVEEVVSEGVHGPYGGGWVWHQTILPVPGGDPVEHGGVMGDDGDDHIVSGVGASDDRGGLLITEHHQDEVGVVQFGDRDTEGLQGVLDRLLVQLLDSARVAQPVGHEAVQQWHARRHPGEPSGQKSSRRRACSTAPSSAAGSMGCAKRRDRSPP